eukprot:TRINITY_DN1827_c0_g1_i1.p1 TRINITY_DN1827_c0_g1~~TRINITY_DN1827_c0_g1_i1.p1  ORF type:complete len:710 (-),score=220.03 TRINITY_DN1827_c0_g1_i1:288-2417(-)
MESQSIQTELVILLNHLQDLNPTHFQSILKFVHHKPEDLMINELSNLLREATTPQVDKLISLSVKKDQENIPFNLLDQSAQNEVEGIEKLPKELLNSFSLLLDLYELCKLLNSLSTVQLMKLFEVISSPAPFSQQIQVLEQIQQLFGQLLPQTLLSLQEELKLTQSGTEQQLLAQLLNLKKELFHLYLPIRLILQLDSEELVSLQENFPKLHPTQMQQLLDLSKLQPFDVIELKNLFTIPSSSSSTTSSTSGAGGSGMDKSLSGANLTASLRLSSLFGGEDKNSIHYLLSSNSSTTLPATGSSNGGISSTTANDEVLLDQGPILTTTTSSSMSNLFHDSTTSSSSGLSSLFSTTNGANKLLSTNTGLNNTNSILTGSGLSHGLGNTTNGTNSIEIQGDGDHNPTYDGAQQPRLTLRLIEQPPEKSVYKRNLKPNPMVQLIDSTPSSSSALSKDPSLFIAPILIRCDTLEEIPKLLTGHKPVKVAPGRVVVFRRLKITATSHQQGESLFSLRFELRKYHSPTSYSVLDTIQSNPICILSHSTQLKPCLATISATICEVIPYKGSIKGGTRVAVLGNNFVDNPSARVRFDGVGDVMPVFHGPRTLICVTPKWKGAKGAGGRKGGIVSVRVSNDSKVWSQTAASFTFEERGEEGEDEVGGEEERGSMDGPVEGDKGEDGVEEDDEVEEVGMGGDGEDVYLNMSMMNRVGTGE